MPEVIKTGEFVVVMPPKQCSAQRKATIFDRFWCWYYGYGSAYGGTRYLTQCWHYQDHAKYNPDNPRLRVHESRTGHKWSG